MHANSAREVPARLEALAATGGLSRAALHSQFAAAVQVVLHMRRLRSGARVLDAVGVPVRAGGVVEVVPGVDTHRWLGRRAVGARRRPRRAGGAGAVAGVTWSTACRASVSGLAAAEVSVGC